MKKLLLATGLLLAGFSVKAQAINPPTYYQYCILYEGYNSKWVLSYERDSTASTQTAELAQEAQALKSLSEVQALNYLSRHGWEFVSTSIRTQGERYISTSTQYLWRRKY